MSVLEGRSAKSELILTTRCQYCGDRSVKFELILTTSYQYWGLDLPADIGVDLPNLNSSWPLDVSTSEGRSGGRSRGRSAKFELILTTRCQYWGVDLPNLNSSWPLDVSTSEGRSGGRSRGRSAKYELILTTRCQYWGVVDLLADLGLDLPTRCQYGKIDLVADLRIDLPNLNLSWPLVVSTGG